MTLKAITLIVWGVLLKVQTDARCDASVCAMVEQGESALAKGLFDSAIVCYWNGHLKGMSKDSLFYLLSNVNYAKQVFDTAIALNLAARPGTNRALHKKLLYQRYAIYSALQLDNYVNATLDSLRKLDRSIPFVLFPDLNLSASMGYGWERQIAPSKYSWSFEPLEQEFDTVAGLSYAGRAELMWSVPLRNSLRLSLGFAGKLARNYFDSRQQFATDTLSYYYGGAAALHGIGDILALSAEVMRKRDTYQNYVTNSDFSLSMLTPERIFYTSLNYFLSLKTGNVIGYDQVYAISYLDLRGRKKAGVGITLFNSLFRSDPLTTIREYKKMYIDDVNADTIRHYSDSTFSNQIPLPMTGTILENLAYLNQVNESFDAVAYEDRLPQTFWQTSATIHYASALPWKLEFKPGLQYSFSYYPDAYIWHNDSVAQQYDIVACSRMDDACYGYTDGERINTIVTRQFFDGPLMLPNRPREQRRIDHEIGVQLRLSRKVLRSSSINMRGEFSRIVTSLSPAVPVHISQYRWYFTAAFSHQFSFK
ncbi:MAG: hypothetical protein GF398_16040 [Chitinivibrionales bacterium]|nr:hypothetical protein [Chitinivibrionales bacterium]